MLLLTVLAIPAAATGSALASPLASRQAEAARVMAQLDLLQTRHDQAVVAERAAATRLATARALVAASRVQIAAAQHSLTVSRTVLATELVSTYKSDSNDALSYVLAAASFDDLLTRVDLLHRAASSDRDLIDQIVHTQRLLTAQQAARREAASEAAQAHAAAVSASDALARAISKRQAVLVGVNAQVRSMLAREQQRRRGLENGAGGGDSGTGSSGGGGTSSGGGSPQRSNVFYGECTWYGPGFAGHPTASGEPFDPNALTAASPWLPFNTQLMVTNLSTGLSVQVRVNDRGPFGRGVLDLSAHAAQIVHLSGWQRVRIEILSSGPSAARTIMP